MEQQRHELGPIWDVGVIGRALAYYAVILTPLPCHMCRSSLSSWPSSWCQNESRHLKLRCAFNTVQSKRPFMFQNLPWGIPLVILMGSVCVGHLYFWTQSVWMRYVERVHLDLSPQLLTKRWFQLSYSHMSPQIQMKPVRQSRGALYAVETTTVWWLSQLLEPLLAQVPTIWSHFNMLHIPIC